MTGLSNTLARTAAAAVVTLGLVGRADAATIGVDNTNPQNIPGVTGFITTGAMMNGMSVTAYFKDGGFETEIWGATGLDAGGVIGTNWGLSLGGDSYTNSWSFTNDKAGKLTRLVLDGSNGLTVFDKRQPHFGSDGSFSGLDFLSSLGGDRGDGAVIATYRNPVGIAGAGAVGDLFQILDINFAGLRSNGTSDSFTFVQDTDNDSRLDSNDIDQLPEPTMLALFGIGLVGVARAGRRRRG